MQQEWSNCICSTMLRSGYPFLKKALEKRSLSMREQNKQDERDTEIMPYEKQK